MPLKQHAAAEQLQHLDLRHSQAMAQVKQQHDQDIAQLQLQLQHQTAFQQTDARSASLIKQQQVEHEESLAQHGSQVAQFMQKWAYTQTDAMEFTQAGPEAQLTQQQSAPKQVLADCCIALSNQLVQQHISPTAHHKSQCQPLEVQPPSAFQINQAPFEFGRQHYKAEHEQVAQLEQQLADLQGCLQTEQSKAFKVLHSHFLHALVGMI